MYSDEKDFKYSNIIEVNETVNALKSYEKRKKIFIAKNIVAKNCIRKI